MSTLEPSVRDFLSQKRIAVAGVSRSDRNAAANLIYRKLRDTGHEVYPVNPRAGEVEGARCFPQLAAIPGGVTAVVAAATPEGTEKIARDSAELGISRVWIHRSFGKGSLSEKAVAICREKGIKVIPGGCPMMFCEPVDVAHRCIRWWLRMTGKLPRPE